MSKDYGKYLKFLASGYDLLYIGRDHANIYDEVSAYFASSFRMDVNKQTLEELEMILSHKKTDIVIFDVQDNDALIIDFFHFVKKFDDEIITFLMFEPKEYRKFFDIIPLVDASITYPIDKAMLRKKLFAVLSVPYAVNSIGRREIMLKHDGVKEENAIDEFFDTYQGSALFLADDIMEFVKALDAGDLSHEFFTEIAQKLEEVAEIFSKAEQTSSITPVYEELALYLKNLQLETIRPENLSGFTYLSHILSDVSVFLMDMFVDRIFKDVHLFEYSLENNIFFMKSKLEGKYEEEDDDDDDLEFF